LHASGDHSLCRKSCAGVQREITGLRPVEGEPGRFPGVNPETEMEQLAARLAVAHRDDPSNALIARELRMTLQSLKPGGPPRDAGLQALLNELSAT
jgi:hypothetical protein